MAWSTPLTAVANTALTAAQWNASVRDNLLETVPSKATTAGALFSATGANGVAERVIVDATIDTAETTTSTTFVSLATPGPTVNATIGTKGWFFTTCQQDNSVANTGTFASFELSGGTTSAPTDSRSIIVESAANSSTRGSVSTILSGLGAGSTTVDMKYRVAAGTGRFQRRRLQVLPL